jgi:hypothetical protein
MTVPSALAILEYAVNATDDVRTEEVLAALDFLEARSTIKWPFGQYRSAFVATERREIEVAKEGRRQVLHASLNGIKRVVQSS